LNKLAAVITAEEVTAAATYYSSLKPRATINVVESETAPKTVVTAWFLTPVRSGETEPLGERIIEVATNFQQYVDKDSRAHFIAYVPKGSIEKGRALATGGDTSVQCATCHGPGLKGAADFPRIAGLSPTYIFRQLYDFKHGARVGAESSLMKSPLEKLSTSDMIALAAYAASLAP
jgi:cytochrome c553